MLISPLLVDWVSLELLPESVSSLTINFRHFVITGSGFRYSCFLHVYSSNCLLLFAYRAEFFLCCFTSSSVLKLMFLAVISSFTRAHIGLTGFNSE